MDTVGAVDIMYLNNITVLHAYTKRNNILMWQQGPITWEKVRRDEIEASNNYLHPDSPYQTTHNALPPVLVGEPCGGTVRSSGTRNIACLGIPMKACSAHILPTITCH
eukprot:5589384-Ditylum_brightwellii.AAC.1